MPACTNCVLAPSSMSPLERSATAFVSGIPDSAWECGIPKLAAAFSISDELSECICVQRFCPSRNDIACWCVSALFSWSGNMCFNPVYSSFIMNAFLGLWPWFVTPTGSCISTACHASSFEVTVSAVSICPGSVAVRRYDPRYFGMCFSFASRHASQ